MPDRYDADGIKYGRAFEKDPAMRQALSDTSIEDKVKITQAHKNINALAGQLEKSQRDFHKQLKSVSASITSTAKQQQKLVQQIKMKELSSSRDVKVVEKSVQQILGKMGYVVDSLGKTTKRIMVDTARSTKEHLKEYGRALSADFSIHKGNFLAMTLAKATPIFGYFVGKFMETTVFRHFADLIKTKLGMAITFVGNKMRDLLSRALGVFKRKKSTTTRTREEYDEELPHLQKGGYVKKSGAAHIHAAEVVTPITKMREAFKNALKPLQGAVVKELRGLRYATVGIGRDFFASFSLMLMRNPIFKGLAQTFQLMRGAYKVAKFFFGRQKNKYYTFLSKNTNPQARAADNIGIFYIGAMLKYDIMISHLRSIEEHLTGRRSRAPRVETWSNYEMTRNMISSGTGLFGDIKEKFKSRRRKKTAPDWEAYERYDEFGNIIPGTYSSGTAGATGTGDKIPEYVRKSSVYKYFDKKYSRLEKTIKGTDTFKYLNKKYKKLRKTKAVVGIEDLIEDLQSGEFDANERLEDLKKGTKKTYKKGRKWTRQNITGVSGKGLTEAAIWVTVTAPLKTLLGAVRIVNKTVIGIAKATMWMAKLPFKILFKTISMAIRSLLMIGRGISKLTHAIVSLPFKLANTVINLGSKIITGSLQGISSVLRYVSKAGGVGAAIKKVASKAWYGSGKTTAGKKGAAKVAAANAREKQKTGVEGELQKIRHSITEFHGSVSEDWADVKFEKKKDNKWWGVIKNAKDKAKEIKKAWAKTKKEYQRYRDKVAGKEKKKETALLTRIAEATESTDKRIKKSQNKLWDWIKTGLGLLWGAVSSVGGMILTGLGTLIGGAVTALITAIAGAGAAKTILSKIPGLGKYGGGGGQGPTKGGKSTAGKAGKAKGDVKYTKSGKIDMRTKAGKAAAAKGKMGTGVRAGGIKGLGMGAGMSLAGGAAAGALAGWDVAQEYGAGAGIAHGMITGSLSTIGGMLLGPVGSVLGGMLGDAIATQARGLGEWMAENFNVFQMFDDWIISPVKSLFQSFGATWTAIKEGLVKNIKELLPDWAKKFFNIKDDIPKTKGQQIAELMKTDPEAARKMAMEARGLKYTADAPNREIAPKTRTTPIPKRKTGLWQGVKNLRGMGSEGKAFTGSQADFVKQMYANLLNSAQNLNIPYPDVIAKLGTAQSSLETGYGKHAPGNNFFGIKGGSGPAQTTKEFINGSWVTIQDKFRSYSSIGDSAQGYLEFLQQNRRYQPVLSASNIHDAIVAQGNTGYATDPAYAQKLFNINANVEKTLASAGSVPKAHTGADVVGTNEGVAVLRRDERVLSPSQVVAYDRITTDVLPKLAETIGHLTAASQAISNTNIVKTSSSGVADNRRIFNIFGNTGEDKNKTINKLFNGNL